ncbi:MAG: fumarylacetoacetate hydrolase, partial [Xanthobacteraceae bacterium]
MKLAFFDNYKLGVVVGDKIVDVSGLTKGIKALGPQDVIRGVIEKWSTYKGKFAAAAKKGKGSKPLSKVKLRPPLPKPENIICMAVNYMENGTLPAPAPINAFMKSPSAV